MKLTPEQLPWPACMSHSRSVRTSHPLPSSLVDQAPDAPIWLPHCSAGRHAEGEGIRRAILSLSVLLGPQSLKVVVSKFQRAILLADMMGAELSPLSGARSPPTKPPHGARQGVGDQKTPDLSRLTETLLLASAAFQPPDSGDVASIALRELRDLTRSCLSLYTSALHAHLDGRPNLAFAGLWDQNARHGLEAAEILAAKLCAVQVRRRSLRFSRDVPSARRYQAPTPSRSRALLPHACA